MATNINNGDQQLTFDYKNPGTGSSFNKLLYNLLPAGIYGGLPTFTRISDTSINIGNFSAILNDPTNSLSIKMTTTESATVTVSDTEPLVVARYIWSESTENYVEMTGIVEVDLTDSDIILVKCLYSGSVLTGFDDSEAYISEIKTSLGRGASSWDDGASYEDENTIVNLYDMQFLAYNLVGNVDKNPLENADYWYGCPSKEALIQQYYKGEPLLGGFCDIFNRNSGNYRQNTLVGKHKIGNSFYEFYMVMLDGTVVTGDSTLEEIFGIGGDTYFKIDDFAPDSGGIRTLKDAGDYVFTPQSDGGDNAVVGELVLDQMQGHWHDITNQAGDTGSAVSYGDTVTGATNRIQEGGASTGFSLQIKNPRTDTVNGDPRTGSTTHGKRMTVGSAYIIIMKKVVA